MADISVIIATYNVAPYIERAIRSALDQVGVTVEIIIADDCSTDDTFLLCQKIDDPRIKCLRLAQNCGPSVARNLAIASATSPWLAILDGDDIFLPGRLLRFLEYARSTKADVLVDNIEVFTEATGHYKPMFPPVPFAARRQIDLADFIDGNCAFLGGHTLGYLKPVVSSIFLHQHRLSYAPDIRIGEDYMLLAEALALNGRCMIVPGIGYRYTVRAGSISARLTQFDVDRINTGDVRFLARHSLPPSAIRAQNRRRAALTDASAFIKLVDGLKSRDVLLIVRAVRQSPLTIRHLWRPVWARARKLFCS